MLRLDLKSNESYREFVPWEKGEVWCQIKWKLSRICAMRKGGGMMSNQMKAIENLCHEKRGRYDVKSMKAIENLCHEKRGRYQIKWKLSRICATRKGGGMISNQIKAIEDLCYEWKEGLYVKSEEGYVLPVKSDESNRRVLLSSYVLIANEDQNFSKTK